MAVCRAQFGRDARRSVVIVFKFFGDTSEMPGRGYLEAVLRARLDRMESVLADRECDVGAPGAAYEIVDA